MMKQPIFWLLLILSSIGVFLYSNVTASEQAELTSPTKRVRISTAQQQTHQRNPTFAGIVRAKNRANLAFSDSSGRLLQRQVEVGDVVSAGQTLAQLDNSAHKHAVNAARANIADLKARIAQNRRDLQRVEALVAKQAATDEEQEMLGSAAESLNANLAAAEVQLAEAKRRLDETTLRAPFAGTITDTFMEPGEFATPGRPVVAISGADDYEIEIEVPESMLVNLQKGQTVNIQFPLQHNRSAIGKITSIGQASQDTRLFPILIEPEASESLIAGMSAEITLSINLAETTTIPVQAVINPGGQHPAVFRLQGKQVQRVSVDVGDLIGEQITVQGKLQPGDTIVVGGHAGLVDGDTVEVVQ